MKQKNECGGRHKRNQHRIHLERKIFRKRSFLAGRINLRGAHEARVISLEARVSNRNRAQA